MRRSGPAASAGGRPANRPAGLDGRLAFRSPSAVVVWWLWLLFAVGNLIDLAIQGRDHLSVVAACALLAVTGVVYVTAQRPRIVADSDGLTIVNPLRVHRVGWPAISGTDATDLLRVRCQWPAAGGAPAEGGQLPGKRAICSWAVHSSRRSQIAARARAARQAGRGTGPIGAGGFDASQRRNAPPPAPLALDAAIVVAALAERAERARAAAPDALAVPPASSWHWPALVAVLAPGAALLIAVLV